MNSLKAYIKKEIIEGVRTYKFLILAVGILFFAVLDPVTMKMLPLILKGQFGSLDFGSLIDISQRGVMASNLKNLFQLSTLVICISLMGIIANEKNEKTLTMPVSMGCNTSGVIIGKWIVYSLYINIMVVVGMLFTYFYAGMLFEFDFANVFLVIKSALLYGLFYTYVLSMLIMLSSIFKSSFVAGITTLISAYGMSGLGFFFPKITKFLPTTLLEEAKSFSEYTSNDFYVTLSFTIVYVLVFLFISIKKLASDELV